MWALFENVESIDREVDENTWLGCCRELESHSSLHKLIDRFIEQWKRSNHMIYYFMIIFYYIIMLHISMILLYEISTNIT